MSPVFAVPRRLVLPALGVFALLGAALAGLAAAGSDDTGPLVSRVPADGAALDGAARDGSVPKPDTKPVREAAPATVACTGQRFIGQRIACYSDRAVQAGDPRVCLQAETPDVRWPCVAKYAVVAGDADTCRLLPGPAGPGAAETASTDGDVQAAPESGAHSVAVDLCLSTLALVYHRPDLCRELTTDTMDDACLAKLVSSGGDPALCDQIESEQLRDVCVPDPLAEVAE